MCQMSGNERMTDKVIDKKLKNRHAIFIALFVLLLILSNPIVASISTDDVHIGMAHMEGSDAVHYYIDSMVARNDLQEKIMISGWAFCETGRDNTNREVWIILDSDDKVYSIKANLYERDDIQKAFPELEVRGTRQGFLVEFSTLNIRSGTYGMWVYCKENDMDAGTIMTDYSVKKSGKVASVDRETM